MKDISYATKSDLGELENQLGVRFDTIEESIKDLSEQLSMVMQVSQTQFDEIREEQRDFRRSMNRLTDTIDGFLTRIDHYETEMVARDSQFQKLLD
jgi:chromosome segregation ATPase